MTSTSQTSHSQAPRRNTKPEGAQHNSDNALVRGLKVAGRGIATVWSVPKARFGIILLSLIILIAVFAPLLSPYDPKASEFEAGAAPSIDHWLGTTGQRAGCAFPADLGWTHLRDGGSGRRSALHLHSGYRRFELGLYSFLHG
jgi:hypothetical protein